MEGLVDGPLLVVEDQPLGPVPGAPELPETLDDPRDRTGAIPPPQAPGTSAAGSAVVTAPPGLPCVPPSTATLPTAPTWLAIPLTPPVYSWCLRTTHSDVMCVSNTTRLFRDPGPPGADGAKPRRCRLPYSDPNVATQNGKLYRPPPSTSATSTLLSKQQEAKSRARMNQQLLKERDEFLARLHQERLDRLETEKQAAMQIQSLYRGYSCRPHPESVVLMKDRRRARLADGELSIETAMLKQLELKLGLPSLPGLTLSPPSKVSSKQARRLARQQRERQAEGALRIQSMARCSASREAVRVKRETRARDRQQASAISIQRGFRNHQYRGSKRKRTEHRAAVAIQAANRGRLAREQVKRIRNQRSRQSRERSATVTMQRVARGRKARNSGIGLPTSPTSGGRVPTAGAAEGTEQQPPIDQAQLDSLLPVDVGV